MRGVGETTSTFAVMVWHSNVGGGMSSALSSGSCPFSGECEDTLTCTQLSLWVVIESRLEGPASERCEICWKCRSTGGRQAGSTVVDMNAGDGPGMTSRTRLSSEFVSERAGRPGYVPGGMRLLCICWEGEAGGAARVLETTDDGGARRNKLRTGYLMEIFGTRKSFLTFHRGMAFLIALTSLLSAL
ncbi:hypothetical protein DFJ58DRAFT_763149 [Suillus subalutaceus]|uniref:uncharacterized protein n=1 Tax=Suillus subalutaceus TaxID=48586 RepID=UPI001B8788B8|nr:uncharacterized protein DFJ58DRAFT_763149 [Suillus subalutaceus]KAG1871280.1 hypothetical protein DFJ58DRAFT_763149 [Suillus subalutaceus]